MESLIVIRLIHIMCSVIWTGSMIYFAAFVIPTAKALGDDGFKFLNKLISTNKLPIIMNISAVLSIITGIILMKRLLGGLSVDVLRSSHGFILVLGGALALVSFAIGLSVNFPAARRMNAIGKMLSESDSQPDLGQINELQQLRNKSFAATNIIALLLFTSLILMSVVKYF